MNHGKGRFLVYLFSEADNFSKTNPGVNDLSRLASAPSQSHHCEAEFTSIDRSNESCLRGVNFLRDGRERQVVADGAAQWSAG